MAKMIQCKTCGADIAKSAKVCPYCGAKNRRRLGFGGFLLIVVWAIFISVILNSLSDSGSSSSTQATRASVNSSQEEKDPTTVRAEYIESCEPLDYSAVARDPDDYKGKPIKFSGTVIQVSESSWSNSVTYRVATKGSYEDIVYVTYRRADGESRILENDVITGYGDCDGITSYMSVLGGTVTIPSVKMQYYDAIE